MDSKLRRVEDLFHRALEQPRESRAAWLAAVCTSDLELQREVATLLARDEQQNGLLKKDAWNLAAEMISMGMPLPTDGMKLGHFEISGLLGQGGMGVVYQARDTRLNRTVAIKVLSPYVSHRPEVKERLKREAQTIGALNHPNICT